VLRRAAAQPARDRRWSLLASVALVLPAAVLLLTSCTASTPSAPPAATTPATRPASQPGTSYASTSFAVPFDVDLPSWVTPGAKVEERDFVTWDGAGGTALRVMHPVQVDSPAGGAPRPVPADLLGWLRSLSRFGVRLTDVQRVEAGSYPATLLTVTTRSSVDGSIGCPRLDLPPEDCIGPQPELALRMALLKIRGEQLVIWLRDASDARALTAYSRSFASMIESLRFPDRPVTAVTTTPPVGP
jgi:hypothetical protein